MLPPGRARLATKPASGRIARPGHDDRDRRGCGLQRGNPGSRHTDEDVPPEASQLGREPGDAVHLTVREAHLDLDVLAVDVAELTESLPEPRQVGSRIRSRADRQE